ncbi:flagellar protein [Paenibacillus sp. NPDC056579]|uniref:flagellar protein n=1 Tax=unclassified Paenibacillus TaxID=185978 RepID=UPI001EF80AB9|nr:flagellar protein [Paenibacillus sp. H1-7]ULL15499.1 flagellar protein [Paenibacillus sp. H1-7]
MSILAVANCPGCGRVFQRNLRNMCTDCMKSLDSEFDICYRFMLQNRKATTEQLRSATGVSSQRLTAWIKEKRLSVKDFPHLSYPCNSCGVPIHQNQLCVSCSSRISRDIRDLLHKEEKVASAGIGFRSLRRTN